MIFRVEVVSDLISCDLSLSLSLTIFFFLLLFFRPAEVDGKDVWVPDNFDPSAVGLMMKMAESAKKPTHLYPMAMVSWAVMPPPKQKEKDLGERRLTNYSGVGISAGNELDIAAVVKGVAEGVEPEEVVAKAVHAQVVDEYRVLESMVYDEAFRTSSAEKERFVQPWKKNGAGEKRKKFLGLF
jgi:glycerol-3-phosphate O-acyltransferase